MTFPNLVDDLGGVAGADCTQIIADALGTYGGITIPAGEFLVSRVEVGSAKTIVSEGGYATSLRQIPGGGEDNPVVSVSGSGNFLWADSAITIIGNISTDTGEWNHGVQVRGGRDNRMGSLHGKDLRGDALYVGGTPSSPVDGFVFEDVTGENVLRSIYSNTGGRDVRGRSVKGGHCCYRTFDFEPNAGSQRIEFCSIDYVYGGSGQLASAGDPVGPVEIGTLVLDSGLQQESDPPFLLPGGQHYFSKEIGLLVSNFESLKIGHLVARNKTWNAVHAPNAGHRGEIHIGKCDLSGNGSLLPPQYGMFHVEGAKRLRIDNLGSVALAGRFLITAASDTYVDIANGDISGGPIINKAAPRSRFDGLNINGSGVSLPLFNNLTYPSFTQVRSSGGAQFMQTVNYGRFDLCEISATEFCGPYKDQTFFMTKVNGQIHQLGFNEKHPANAVTMGGDRVNTSASGTLQVNA